jgi:hypothetical protein
MMTGALAFLILQVVAFILTLCWWYPILPNEDPFGLYESARIGRFVVRTLATIAYMAVLGIYARELHLETRESLRLRSGAGETDRERGMSSRKSPYYFQ